MTFANTATGTIDSVTQTFGLPNNSPNGALRTFLINVPATVTYPAGSAFTVTVAQGVMAARPGYTLSATARPRVSS